MRTHKRHNPERSNGARLIHHGSLPSPTDIEHDGSDPAFREVTAKCWCERSSIWLPQAEVGHTTRSCGTTQCRPPAGVPLVIGEVARKSTQYKRGRK